MKKPAPKKPSKPSFNEYLPDDPIEPSDDFDDYVKVIYGRKQVGKTTLVASFPDTLVNMTEKGRSGLRIKQWPDWRSKLNEDPSWTLTFEEEKNFLTALVEHGKGKYKQLAIDTIDQLWSICVNKVLQDADVEKLADVGDWGAGWVESNRLMKELLETVTKSGLGLLLVSHVTTGERKSFTDANVLETVPTMDKRAWAWVQERADFVFLYDMIGSDRVMAVRGDSFIQAGCSPEGRFLDSNGEPINKIKMPDDPTKGYETLLAGFNNELEDYEREKARKEAIRQAALKDKIKKNAKK